MSDTLAFRKMRLAVAAIDGGAKKMGITGREMYERLNRHGLVHSRLLLSDEQLHTQSEEWVVEDSLEFKCTQSIDKFLAVFWRCSRLVLRLILKVCLLSRESVWHNRPENGLSGAKWKAEWLFPLSRHMFCGKEYNVPHDVQACLHQTYGDWQTLPPLEKRAWHTSIISPNVPPSAPWAVPYVKDAHLNNH